MDRTESDYRFDPNGQFQQFHLNHESRQFNHTRIQLGGGGAE